MEQARAVIASEQGALSYTIEPTGNQLKIGLTEQAINEVKNQAIKQNIEIIPDKRFKTNDRKCFQVPAKYKFAR